MKRPEGREARGAGVRWKETLSRTWNFGQRHPGWVLALACGLVLLFLQVPSALRWPVRLIVLLLAGSVVVALVRKVIAIAKKPKRFLFATTALLMGIGLSYALLELACWTVIRIKPDLVRNPYVLSPAQREHIEILLNDGFDYTSFSPVLGWGVKENGTSEKGGYRANAQGFRADREYATEIPEGVRRVLCFGDSFTHCHEVGNDETWEHQAEQAGAGKWEFLNFGVGGFGMAQVYLRFKETIEDFETDFVIIGCMTTDVRRTLNVYYPLRNAAANAMFALTKPYGALDESGQLVIQPNPLPSLDAYREFLENPGDTLREMAKLDIAFAEPPATPFGAIFERAFPATETSRLDGLAEFIGKNWRALTDQNEGGRKRTLSGRKAKEAELKQRTFEINRQLFARFVSEVREAGAEPVILFYPNAKDLETYNERGDRGYADYLEFFEAEGFRAIDVLDWLIEAYAGEPELPAAEIFAIGHYSPKTNRLLGTRMLEYLEALPRKE